VPPTAKPDRAYCPQCGQKYAVPVDELRRRAGLRFRARCRACDTPFSVQWKGGALSTEVEERPDEPAGERDVLSRGAKVGKYEIEEPLASGGSSTVYRAFDPGANRTVALKVLHQSPDADYGLRFRREVEVQGNLKHQNLMPIFDHGTVDGKPYYTMELLLTPLTFDTIIGMFRNRRLTYHPTLRRLNSVRALAARVIVPVARAIAFANGHGVVHRDLKPSNIIVDAQTMRVYVIDFGICHLFKTTGSRLVLRADAAPEAEEQRRMTMGTPRCMPPEQARGDVSEQGDVWALGALLRYLISGDYPVAPAIDLDRVGVTKRIANLEKIVASSRAAGDEDEASFYESRVAELRDGSLRTMKDVLDDARQGNYTPLADDADPVLAAVVERAMRPRPEDRYRDADAFADDVSAWLEGRPVRAYAAKLGARAALYKTRLYARRNRTALLAAAGVLALVLAAGAIYLVRAGANEERQIARWLREARAATDPAVQEDRLRSVLSVRPDHAGALELIGHVRRFKPILAKVEDARARHAEVDRAFDPKRDAPAAEIERAQRLAEETAAVLMSVLPDLRSLPAGYPGRKLEQEVLSRANRLRGWRTLRLRGIPRDVRVSVVSTRSRRQRDLAWDSPQELGVSPLAVTDQLFEPGSHVLVLQRASRAIYMPFRVTYNTRSGSELNCPMDPARLPEGMLYVPGGRVAYGDVRFHEETRTVELEPFLLDEHEVTNAEYLEYLESLKAAQRARAVPRRVLPGAGERTTPVWIERGDGRWTFPDGTARYPVTGISLLDAQDYARWKDKRLPTPQEWERAAQGVDGRDYPFGMQLDVSACNAQTGSAAPVGTYPDDRSPFGAYDMAGNAAEWTDTSGGGAIVKGGSFDLPRYRAHASAFGKRRADLPYGDVGFRCARDVRIP